MVKFIVGMIVGVVLTFTLAAITDESPDGLEYDEDFDDYDSYEEEDECDEEIVEYKSILRKMNLKLLLKSIKRPV